MSRRDNSLIHLLSKPLDFGSIFGRYRGLRWRLGWLWLRVRYPRAPKDAFGRPYPLEHCLSEVGSGWATLVRACYDIVSRQGGSIHQVKEKFGGLRFYVSGVNMAAEEAIWAIGDASLRICEVCGASGKLRDGGWVLTLCDQHAKGQYEQ